MQIASHYLSTSFQSHPSIQDEQKLQPHSPDRSSDFGSDFGGLVHTRPASVLHPISTSDIQFCLQNPTTRIAARGNGHSVSGQSQCHNGLVIDMRSHVLPNGDRFSLVDCSAADVSGGALWSELLTWSYGNFKLAPVSWTDYLDLTVGGTLSNGGISGQAFRRGPQTSNVIEMDVVTADGECHVCSRESGSDLFSAVLGGLGQFGIITRARVVLAPAPDMVKWIRVVYKSFEDYKHDAEHLITRPESETFDYIEGFAFLNCDDAVNGFGSVLLSPESEFDFNRIPADAGPILYCLEVALHYVHGDSVDKRVEEMLDPLRHVRGLEFVADVSYMQFLTRVKIAEKEARANGSWHAPHPWLNILVSSKNIIDFDRKVFKKILKNGIGGPMLVYPLLKCKWGPQISAALPESEIFYLVALLRFNRPYPDGPSIDDLIDQNRQILDRCRINEYDYKMYLPHYETRSEWERHFGNEWSRFYGRKARYDPSAIFAPGQCIFTEGKIVVEEEDGKFDEGVL